MLKCFNICYHTASCAVNHYDGVHAGTCLHVYGPMIVQSDDGFKTLLQVMKTLQGVPLDGKPLNLALVGVPVAAAPAQVREPT